MRRFLAIVPVMFLAVLPAGSQTPKGDAIPYEIEFNPEKDLAELRHFAGKDGVFIKVKFTVTLKPGDFGAFDNKNYQIKILQDDEEVARVDLPGPRLKGLSVVLAVDTSGGIKDNMEQVRRASDAFLKKLPDEAECGLILFNHEIRKVIDPALDRAPVRAAIGAVEPTGGNAGFDALARGIAMLKDLPPEKGKVLVLISNGLDLNSKAKMRDVIAEAKQNKIKIHTIGIGEPTKLEMVNSILVLDHSGSMEAPADDKDPTPKIKGLHEAAARFVDLMPAQARTTLIPFGTDVDTAKPFTRDKDQLKRDVNGLAAEGETALFDAVFAALATLEADNSPGKRVIVAMTDGIDNKSRRRADEVIARAKESKVTLFMLGFGRDNNKEIDKTTMTRLAKEPNTGGEYFHASDQKALFKFFEDLSFKIHEQGIDEKALREIAESTNGKYYHARDKDAKGLVEKLEKSAEDIQSKPEVVFPSRSPDGTFRKIRLIPVRRTVVEGPGGQKKFEDEVLGGELGGSVQLHGVVLAEMNHFVYLTILGVLGSLILLPAFFKRT